MAKRMGCAKTGGPILMIYTSYNVFVQGVAFWGSRWLHLR